MRRLLFVLIGLLSAFIVIAGAVVAGLALWRLGERPAPHSLLVVGDDSRLTILGGDGVGRTLAEDVSAEIFHYPSTSRDGSKIVYISRDAQGLALAALDLTNGERTELYRSASSPPLYAAWSPDGRYVSFLATRVSGDLEIFIVPADGSTEAEQIGVATGSSYFAWRPDGARLLLHTSGQRDKSRVAIFEPGNLEPLSERDDPGFFQAPAWSEDGQAFFYVAQPADEPIESVLTRVGPDGEARTIVSEKQAAILFSRAPGSDTLAYVTVSPDGFGALKVVDGAGGEARTVSRPNESIPAFFWSPDGARIAYLTFERNDSGAPQFTWHLVERDGGVVRDLVSFTPSRSFAGLVGYFDAYAISLELWSPDGRSIVYGSDDGVYALDIATGTPTRRADGALGLWVRR